MDQGLFGDPQKEQREAAFAEVARLLSEYANALRGAGLPESLVHALVRDFHRVNVLRDTERE